MPNVIDKLRETFRPRQRLTVEQYAAKLLARGLHPDGTPILDPTPIAPPIGYKKHPSMVEIVREMVRSEKLAQEAVAAGHETFEESEDFDVGDEDPLMRSPWENQHDPDLKEILEAGRQALAEKEKARGAGADAPAVGARASDAPRPKAKPSAKAPLPEAPEEP